MQPNWFAALPFLFLAGLWYLYCSPNANKNMPPGPWGLPLIGHLHLLGGFSHLTLQRLANKYGPIMSLRFGFVPTFIVSSPEYAELFLKTHDSVCSNRPNLQVSKFFSYGLKDIVFAKYGPYWRNLRRLCTIEMLSHSKISSMMPMRREEINEFIELLKTEAGSVVNVTQKVDSLIKGMTYRMVFGSKEDKGDFKYMLEAIRLIGQFNLADYIPFADVFDLQGINRRMKEISKFLDGFLEKIIDEHEQEGDAKRKQGKPNDFIDVMLSLTESNNRRELQLGRDNIKAVVLDMIGASLDTSTTSIEWTVSELLKNPRVKKLVQEELETVVGLDRMVEEKDLSKLHYLKMVIKETYRLHPIIPLLIPHETTEDITVNGYFIPKKSTLIINSWAIGRDREAWSDNALEFYPERFVDTNIDLQGQDFQLLPFGSGRRQCPGMQLGYTIVQQVVAQLLHCFNLELPAGMSPEDFDMSSRFGLTLPRANNLMAVPTYRLRTNN